MNNTEAIISELKKALSNDKGEMSVRDKMLFDNISKRLSDKDLELDSLTNKAYKSKAICGKVRFTLLELVVLLKCLNAADLSAQDPELYHILWDKIGSEIPE